MARLIVSEKPSMGRSIAAALGLQGKGRNAIQSEGLVVTWCVGHLVELAPPETYDPALKPWRMDTLPIFPDTFRYTPIETTREQFEAVSRWMNHADIQEIVNATDAGREGELIFDLVYRLSGCTKPVLRFWTSSLTDEAIREAYGRMKPGEAYRGLRDAARCRQEADWLVGINATRAQTLAMKFAGKEGVYSLGRVQTPTLALLVNREREILNFTPKDFWTLWALFQTEKGDYKGKWYRKEGDKDLDRFDREDEALAMAERLKGHPGKVAAVTRKIEKKKPELLYDLTNLQKEANKRFGFTAEHTLEVAQKLYEAKLISYPRTNSRHLTQADAEKAPGWIKAVGQGQMTDLQPFIQELRQRWPVKLDKRFVNDKEVEDHSALVPTENPARQLQGDDRSIYELIARRFLAAYFPERVEAKTTILTQILDQSFKTNGTVVKELGWSAVDPPHRRTKKEDRTEEGDEEEGSLPDLAKGEQAEARELKPKAGKTTPPKRMTEGDLLGAMQSAGKELDDEELRGAMKDCGLGTPATRANIIETLLKRGFLERKKQILQPTEKGMELLASLQAEPLKSPQLTGEWEARLERIRRSEDAREAFMEDIRAFVAELVGQIKRKAPRKLTGPSVGSCPKCGSQLLLRTWEEQSYVRCSAAECRVSYPVNAQGEVLERCPSCGGPVRSTKSGSKICVQCDTWQNSPPPVDPAEPCPTCGESLRLIASTRRGQWFLRCRKCGYLKEYLQEKI